MKESDKKNRVVEVQSILSGYPDALVEPHRRFIRDGEMIKISRRAVQRRWFFLFNDLIVYGKKTSSSSCQFKGRISLAMITLREMPDQKKLKNLFQVRRHTF